MVGSSKKYKKNTKKRRRRDGIVSEYYAPGIERCMSRNVCPDIMSVQMCFADTFRLISTGFDAKVYRGNSIFDPDFGTGSTKAQGYDQWAAFYRRFRVIASKIELWIDGNSSNETGLIIVPLNTNSSITTPKQAIELSMNNIATLGRLDTNGSQYLKSYQKTSKMIGVPEIAPYIERDYSAAFGNNPNRAWYWHVFAYDARGTAQAVNITINTKITYYVELYDRETLVNSI